MSETDYPPEDGAPAPQDFADASSLEDGAPVPRGRLARAGRLGRLAAGLAGEALAGGARAMARGERAEWRDLVLTPANASRLADQLSQLRGAAMKMGQLISMDAGELLPREFSDILARLRAEARPMPARELKSVLAEAWGRDWLKDFAVFNPKPIAAASIGQVHRARLKSGRELAVKVQYPGVSDSIDSDVDNVGLLIKWSGLLPEGFDLAALMSEAKRQLHEEADYLAEAEHLQRFADWLGGDPDFAVPGLDRARTRPALLAMDFMPGAPIESAENSSREERDRIAARLFSLALREIFDFGWMQSDPNFANYRLHKESGRIILLDFGATRPVNPQSAALYRDLLRAGLDDDRQALEAAARAIGYFDDSVRRDQRDELIAMMRTAFEPLRTPGLYDFAASDLAERMQKAGMALGWEGDFRHIPPMETLFVHRKIAGLYLLARRLGARLDARALIADWV